MCYTPRKCDCLKHLGRVLGSLHAHGLSQRSTLMGQIVLNSLQPFVSSTNYNSAHVNK